MQYSDVLNFWFKDLSSKDWFSKNENLDKKIKSSFLDLYIKASRGELYTWRKSIQGCLAEIILLDQFSRNIFRDDKQAFACDNMALVLAQEALKHQEIDQLTSVEYSFLIMPFMHSESLEIHNKAIELFSRPGLEYNLEFEIKHKEIIEKFGRYPHRNIVLGRESTKEELEFLKQPGSSF